LNHERIKPPKLTDVKARSNPSKKNENKHCKLFLEPPKKSYAMFTAAHPREINMSERRSYFRIDESIALEFKTLDSPIALKSQPETFFSNVNSLKLYSELKKIDAENAQFLFQIKEMSRPLAEYLHNLNRKIELLGQELMAEQKPQPPSRTIKQVNLSEGGIAFGSGSPLITGDHIALRLVFLPCNAGLSLFAKIIRCEQNPTGEYQVAAKFHGLTEIQQNLIGQQIMRAQMAEKRRLQENI